MRGFKLHSHICKASLRELFIRIPDRIYPNLVREFYTNLLIIRKTLTSLMKNVNIIIQE